MVVAAARAQELLETTDLPIEAISQRCGFGTLVTMRQHFAKLLRTSPTAYRRSYRARADAARSVQVWAPGVPIIPGPLVDVEP
ncbi:helix-turn-helix domain-containing protein [Catenulispora subtropica]|uniref:HTH araC/xylS-type domain-containing protein n=1 Tax=Catenulispora subtropica TaxID=450798 RepID=A0ABP5EAK7_9ACTN